MARSFAGVERFLERLIERPAARLFRLPVQLEQVVRGLERAMDASRVAELDQTWVAHRYRLHLHPTDVVALDDDRDALELRLGEALRRHARARGYLLLRRPQVVLVPSDGVPTCEVRAVAETLDRGLVRSAALGLRPAPIAPPGRPRAPIPGTAPVPWLADPAPAGSARPTPAVSALIDVRPPEAVGWTYAFVGEAATIGRDDANEIVIDDPRVSRRHGRLIARRGTLVYEDLGSSNGSWLDGSPQREVVLGGGDVVRIGDSTLTIRPPR
jgi:hypothetical protein